MFLILSFPLPGCRVQYRAWGLLFRLTNATVGSRRSLLLDAQVRLFGSSCYPDGTMGYHAGPRTTLLRLPWPWHSSDSSRSVTGSEVLPHRQSDPCLWGQEDGAAGGATAGHSHIHMSRHVGKKAGSPKPQQWEQGLFWGPRKTSRPRRGQEPGHVSAAPTQGKEAGKYCVCETFL